MAERVSDVIANRSHFDGVNDSVGGPDVFTIKEITELAFQTSGRDQSKQTMIKVKVSHIFTIILLLLF